MEERSFIIRALRPLLCAVLLGSAFAGYSGTARAQEELQAPSAESKYCPLKNRPLTSLSVDIRPRDVPSSDEDQEVAIGDVVAEQDLPVGCTPEQVAAVLFFLAYGQGCGWSCHDLLQLARFCHPRLYFEDVRVERYGYEPCFLGLHSAAEFSCDLFFLPARLLKYKDSPCVRTPTPHCMLGCNVCGY